MDDNELRRKYAGGTAVVDPSDREQYYYRLTYEPSAKPKPVKEITDDGDSIVRGIFRSFQSLWGKK